MPPKNQTHGEQLSRHDEMLANMQENQKELMHICKDHDTLFNGDPKTKQAGVLQILREIQQDYQRDREEFRRYREESQIIMGKMLKRIEEIEQYSLVLWVRKNKFPALLIVSLVVFILRDYLWEWIEILLKLLGVF